MKRFQLLLLIISLSCTHSPSQLQQSPSSPNATEYEFKNPPLTPPPTSEVKLGQILKMAKDKVYQILVKRPKEIYVTYDRELPYDLLPFEMRNSEYISIGSAFSIKPGKYISCAHVFGLHTRAFTEDFYLKDAQDKIYGE